MKRLIAILFVFVAMLCFSTKAEAGPVRNAVLTSGKAVGKATAAPVKLVAKVAENCKERRNNRQDRRSWRRSARHCE